MVLLHAEESRAGSEGWLVLSADTIPHHFFASLYIGKLCLPGIKRKQASLLVSHPSRQDVQSGSPSAMNDFRRFQGLLGPGYGAATCNNAKRCGGEMASDSDGVATPTNTIFLCAAATVPSLPEASRSLRSRHVSQQTAQPTEEKTDKHASEPDSDDLLVRVQRRDPGALSELFDRYCRLVFSIGHRVLRNRAEAEDLVQDVFLFLWSRGNLFVPGKRSAHEWIIRVIYHRAFDRRRYLITRLSYNYGGKGPNARETNQEAIVDRASRLVSSECNSGEVLYWHSHFETAFKQLSEGQQRTLRMFFYEGYTLVEISRELNEPLVNVRNHYYRGLRRLEKHVDGDTDGRR
jgi:RNA polymerase sigma-70 factor (ECF subfamily)